MPEPPEKNTENRTVIRRGKIKSARTTCRCRRTESIVSLVRGVCSCAELQVFSCYRGWKEACQATRAISTTWRGKLSLSFFFLARQGAEGNLRHSDRNIRGTCNIVCHCMPPWCLSWFSPSSLYKPQRCTTVTRQLSPFRLFSGSR